MPTAKQLVVIASAIAAATVGAGTVGISAIEHSARQEHSATPVPANRSDHPIIGHRASLPKSHWPPMKALA